MLQILRNRALRGLGLAREFLEVIVAIKAGAMAVAEIKPQSVIADLLPAENLHRGKVGLLITAILLSKDVALAARLGTGRRRAQPRRREIGFRAVTPHEGEFGSDNLNVRRLVQRKGRGRVVRAELSRSVKCDGYW